jgi:hypothetical protein
LLPRSTGFFAAGEIGPVGGRNHLHGFTAHPRVRSPRRPALARMKGLHP